MKWWTSNILIQFTNTLIISLQYRTGVYTSSLQMIYLARGDGDEGVEDVVEDVLVIAKHKAHQVDTLRTQSLRTLVHGPCKGRQFHQVPSHARPLTAHAREDKPQWSCLCFHLLHNKVNLQTHTKRIKQICVIIISFLIFLIKMTQSSLTI